MRGIFIAVVLLATLLTFYSALWYKSETIEQDITKRVTDDITEAGAKDVAVDVDGRHVTLSGVVYDQATEQSYLDTADSTYGALGPIDGLTYVAGTGFVKAVKSADGITLKGSVPSEDARAALVEAATGATDGAVDDQLTIGAAEGAWQDEASFGLGQMAALSSGALSVAPGSYALSGTAMEDDAPIKAAFADRDGWQTFTSAPMVGENLSARITALEGDVSDRDLAIAALTGERDTLTGEIDALKADRDGIADERDVLNTQLGTSAAALVAMTANRDDKQQELDDLRASLDENQSNVADLISARDAAQATVAERDVTIEGLNGQITDLTAQNATLADELEAQKSALSGDQSAMQDQITALNADLTGKDAEIEDLQGQLTGTTAALRGKEVELEGLQGQLDAANGKVADGAAQIAALQGTVAERDDTIAGLKGTIAERDTTIAGLQGKLTDTEAEVAKLNDAANTAPAAPVDDGRIAALTTLVAARDATIEELRNAKASGQSAAQLAERCSVRAGSVLENARINFRTATANIDGGSVETLERLTGIALACVGDDLTVEIGGHTDSRGSDENNQALSERRAQAILAFMAERGVPTSGLKAVGYGETRPIGDNATSEGRAANRRISFDWQAR